MPTMTTPPLAVPQAALQQAFPHATAQQVERVLWQLWEHDFLFTHDRCVLSTMRWEVRGSTSS